MPLMNADVAWCRGHEVGELGSAFQRLVDPARAGQILRGSQPADGSVPIAQRGGAAGDR